VIRDYFPRATDVEDAIKYRTTSYTEIRQFYQSKGVFHVGSSKRSLARSVSPILLSHKDYMKIRGFSQGFSLDSNISGFTLESERVALTQEIIKDDLISLKEKIQSKDEKLNAQGGSFQSLRHPVISGESLSSVFKYERIIPGRIELIKRVESSVKFTIERIDNRRWRLICFPKANKDVQMLENLFLQNKGKLYKPYKISLDDFDQEQKIRFFDDILDYYNSNSQWRLHEVTGITIRRNLSENDSTETDDIWQEESEDVVEGDISVENSDLRVPSRADLISINQAILEGNHLRNNSFVKDCENQGFYFTSMTLALQNLCSPEFIRITIRFKLSPKLFEVILNDSTINNELEYEEDATELMINRFTQQRKKEILKEVWELSHEIWECIKRESEINIPYQLTIGDVENFA
jgi:hypothetical protein